MPIAVGMLVIHYVTRAAAASKETAPATANGTELKEETLNAWGAYVQQANSEMDDRLHGRFLWVEEVAERLQRVRTSNILVSDDAFIQDTNLRPLSRLISASARPARWGNARWYPSWNRHRQ